MNHICHPILSQPVKHYLLLLACLCAVTAFAAEEQPQFVSGKPQNGVFFTYMGSGTTVLELKDGHFRYWFESDYKSQRDPDYPLAGVYSMNGDTITLKHDQISQNQKQWTFRTSNGFITLWRPNAMDFKTDTKFDLKRLKSFGAGSILTLADKRAEDVWKHRGPPKL